MSAPERKLFLVQITGGIVEIEAVDTKHAEDIFDLLISPIAATGTLSFHNPVEEDKFEPRADLVPQWQPIETAKHLHEDTHVLAYPVLPARGQSTRVASCTMLYAREAGATHWMPLPTPPEAD